MRKLWLLAILIAFAALYLYGDRAVDVARQRVARCEQANAELIRYLNYCPTSQRTPGSAITEGK